MLFEREYAENGFIWKLMIFSHTDASQQTFYHEGFALQIKDAINGRDATVFTSGGSGTGKTVTMLG